MLKVYNSLSNKKEDFKTLEEGKVKIYSCGPTVYNFVHIGNHRAYIVMDLIVKTLRLFGYEVINVMNLTDVDDKTIRDSGAVDSDNPNKRLSEFTRYYEERFFEDLERINVERPVHLPRATESIKQMETLIQRLYEKGYAYVSEDGIYYDISKNKTYGMLVKLELGKLEKNEGNRMIDDEYDKEDAKDFVLWKFARGNEPSWNIELGGTVYKGRPGWHIECSAMSMKYLGEHFDIHTGGVDLKFPHHENEIAQSECANGVKYVNYWLHNEHMVVEGKKMSKSLGNFYTLRDIEAKGYSMLAFRFLMLSVHYRQQLNFTFDSLEGAENTVKRINDFYRVVSNLRPFESEESGIGDEYQHHRMSFMEAIADDFNTPVALSSFFEFERFVNRNIRVLTRRDIEQVSKFMKEFNSVFSVLEDFEVPAEIKEKAEKRQRLREEKNFAEADKIRDEISKKGYEVKDYDYVEGGYLILKKKY